jgi:hypothetical protein
VIERRKNMRFYKVMWTETNYCSMVVEANSADEAKEFIYFIHDEKYASNVRKETEINDDVKVDPYLSTLTKK